MTQDTVKGILIVIAGISVIPIMILNAWIFTILWAWFIVPIFELPQLSIAVAVSLIFVFTVLRHSSYNEAMKQEYWKKKYEEEGNEFLAKAILRAYIEPFMVLLIGRIIKVFI